MFCIFKEPYSLTMSRILTIFLCLITICSAAAQNTAPFFHERPFNYEQYSQVCERLQGGYFAYGMFQPGPLSPAEPMLVRYNAYGQQILARTNKGRLIQYISKMLPLQTGFLGLGVIQEARTSDTIYYLGFARFNDNLQIDSTWKLAESEGVVALHKGRFSGDWWLLTSKNWSLKLKRLSPDLSQVKLDTVIQRPTGLPNSWGGYDFRGDILEFDQPRRLIIAVDHTFLADSIIGEPVMGIISCDTLGQIQHSNIAYITTPPMYSDNYGVMSRAVTSCLAYGTDSTFLLYGQVRRFPTFGGTVWCATDTCIRQCQTEWTINGLQRIRTWVSPYTRKPALFQGVVLGSGREHLVWGMKDYLWTSFTNDTRDETAITLFKYSSPQQIAIQREMNQVGYWLKPNGVISCANGDYLMWGQYFDFINNVNYRFAQLAFFTRFNLNGNFLVNTREEVISKVDWSIHPNPIGKNGLTLTIKDDESANSYNLKILDVTGKVMLQTKVESGTNWWAKPAWPAGLYLAVLENNGRLLGSQKLMLLAE